MHSQNLFFTYVCGQKLNSIQLIVTLFFLFQIPNTIHIDFYLIYIHLDYSHLIGVLKAKHNIIL